MVEFWWTCSNRCPNSNLLILRAQHLFPPPLVCPNRCAWRIQRFPGLGAATLGSIFIDILRCEKIKTLWEIESFSFGILSEKTCGTNDAFTFRRGMSCPGKMNEIRLEVVPHAATMSKSQELPKMSHYSLANRSGLNFTNTFAHGRRHKLINSGHPVVLPALW